MNLQLLGDSLADQAQRDAEYKAAVPFYAALNSGANDVAQIDRHRLAQRQDAQGRRSFARAYALTTPQEYFAEGTEAFFGRNDFFPYDRAELRRHDPDLNTALDHLHDHHLAYLRRAPIVCIGGPPVSGFT